MEGKTSLAKSKDSHDKKRFYKLYEDEQESDVTLMVGPDGSQERIPAHTWVLASGTDYFKTLFYGPMANTALKVHCFDDDPNGFNNLIKWLYQNKCDIQSWQTSLETLIVAIKYMCPDLAERCIIQLRSQVNVNNVLDVLGWIHWFCYNSSKGEHSPEPSAPSLDDIEQNYNDNSTNYDNVDPTASCQLLLNECLELIDQQSDAVLSSENLPVADEAVVRMVIKRNTLKLSSELKVVKALRKWANAMCKRKQYPLTLENRRKVLGPLLYLVRFLTLSSSEVDNLRSDSCRLLTDEELVFIESYVRKQPHLPPVPETMVNYISPMSHIRGQKECGPGTPGDFVVDPKGKRKNLKKRRFNINKKDIILDLVSVLGLIFD